jgi:hypothetical protein
MMPRDPLGQLADEGFIDEESTRANLQRTVKVDELILGMGSVHDTEGEYG